MAFERKKIITYAGAGVIIALIVIVFIPVNETVSVNPYVSLDQIPDYGLQYIKVSGEQADITHIYLSIHTVEARLPSGEWVHISDREILWDIIQEPEKMFEINIDDLSPGTYSRIRFYVAADSGKTNATLSNNLVIPLGLQTNPFELEITETEIPLGIVDGSLTLRIGSGIVSNQMLPDYHIIIGTSKIGGEISVQ